MFKERYDKSKIELLEDKTICKENRNLFKKFFELQEVKLKRMNGLQTLDEPTYKTLVDYTYKFRNVNKWFDNKPIEEITKKQFEKVFNDLCDGKIKTSNGEPFKDIDGYVSKIFKGKLFKLAKRLDITEETLEFYKSQSNVQANFIEEKDVYRIIDHAPNSKKKLLFLLGFDIGENVSSLLQLKKRDCRRQYNETTKENEYLIHLKKSTLKRSRQERTEPTRLHQTTELLDAVLKELDDNDFIFSREDNMVRTGDTITKNVPFVLRSAEIMFDRIVSKLGIKTIPKGLKPKLKDIRSSMACDCLKKGWSSEEVNSRLGHSEGSKALKPYITFLALDKNKPKIREYKENISGLNEKLSEQKNVNILMDKRVQELQKSQEDMKQIIKLLLDKGIKTKPTEKELLELKNFI